MSHQVGLHLLHQLLFLPCHSYHPCLCISRNVCWRPSLSFAYRFPFSILAPPPQVPRPSTPNTLPIILRHSQDLGTILQHGLAHQQSSINSPEAAVLLLAQLAAVWSTGQEAMIPPVRPAPDLMPVTARKVPVVAYGLTYWTLVSVSVTAPFQSRLCKLHETPRVQVCVVLIGFPILLRQT